MVNYIVVTRPGHDIGLNDMSPALANRIVDLRGSTRLANIADRDESRIFLTDAVRIEISATEIRRAARADEQEELSELVTPPVADYIKKYKLYRDKNEAKFNG